MNTRGKTVYLPAIITPEVKTDHITPVTTISHPVIANTNTTHIPIRIYF